MDGNTFPRTMTKGIFRGRTFASQKEYEAALRARAKGQTVKFDEDSFTLIVVKNGRTTQVKGKPTEAVLRILSELVSEA